MMPAQLLYPSSRILAACSLLALSACANPALNNQLANTREAIDQAQIAGAEETAPATYQAAVDKLQQADAAAKTRDKDKAMRLAQQAQVDANLARARTDSSQARLAAAEVEKSNQILRNWMTRANQNQER